MTVISALVMGALLSSQATTPAPAPARETVRIGDRQVPLVFPEGRQTFAGSAFSKGDQWWPVITGSETPVLFAPRRGRGGWDEVASRYQEFKDKPALHTARVQVLLLTEFLNIHQGADGTLERRRSTMGGFQTEQVYGALAQFAAAARVASEGAVAVQFDVRTDDDLLPLWTGGSDGDPYQRLAEQVIAPRVNGSAFETDDGAYRGPYATVFVLHAGLTDTVELRNVGRLSVAFVPFWTSARDTVPESLAGALFRVWPAAMASHALGRGATLRARLDDPTQDSEPVTGSPRSLTALVEAANFNQIVLPTPPRPADVELDLNVWAGENQLLDFLAAALPGGVATPLGQVNSAPRASLEAWIQAAGVTRTEAPRLPARPAPFGLGDWSVKSRDADVLEVERLGLHTRGHLVLAQGDLGVYPANQRLAFTFKANTLDPLAVTLWSGNRALVSYQLTGEVPIFQPWDPDFPTDRSQVSVSVPIRRLDGDTEELRTIRVDLSGSGEPAPVTMVTFGPPIGGEYVTRPRGGPQTYVISIPQRVSEAANVNFVPSGVQSLIAQTPGGAPLGDQERARIDQARASTDPALVLNAVGRVMGRTTANDVPWLTELASGPDTLVALAACRALAMHGPAGWEGLRNVLRDGPFDANRLAASFEIGRLLRSEVTGLTGEKFVCDESWIPAARAALLSRSGRTRQIALALFGRLATQESPFVLVSGLQDPDPAVRAAACAWLDPANDLAGRRLLFTAVNDPFEFVRAAAYRRLILSGNDDQRREAEAGVKDDGINVRIAVLNAWAQSSDLPRRRRMSLVGMADRDPLVQVAALDALPGEGTGPDALKGIEDVPDYRVQDAVRRARTRLAPSTP